MSSVLCMHCNLPLRLTEKQAEKLDCDGLHILVNDENEAGIPIRNKGLRTKTGVIMEKVEYGLFVEVGSYSDLYGCRIGNRTKIGSHVVIKEDVVIGNNCEIGDHVSIQSGTRIGNCVFIGPGAILATDKNPRATGKWKMAPVIVEDDVSIGAGAIINPGVTLGRGGLVRAGEVVRYHVDANL